MSEEIKAKILKTRVQNKHDKEVNWNLANNFIPLAGEIIIYDPDETHSLPRVKIGDGKTYVKQLDFVDADLLKAISEKADIDHGIHVSFGTDAPVMDGTASAGTETTVARSDHKHPVDTSRAAKADLIAHTDDADIHITSAERDTWNTAKTKLDNLISCGTTDPSSAVTSQFYFKYATN